ncbi:glycogen debranching N-terminal domain-containing protein [Plantactinospora sp. GCM10030261]|uniref:amylo-alpha-1,6-glucosidase n=1 Tax=Plantactinospora sp. GCM10030261 TaxID=3273420 RepID=UPI0036100A84
MSDLVSILDGNSFVVSDRNGDIVPSVRFPTGVFSFDTRFISAWILSVNGERLNPLSTDDVQYYEARFFLVPGEPTHYVDAKLSVIRHRSIGGSFDERLTVFNHDGRAMDILVRLDIAGDFADLFEIKNSELDKRGRITTEIADNELRMIYQRDRFRRMAVISTSVPPTEIDESGLAWKFRLDPRDQWVTDLRVETVVQAAPGYPTEVSIQRHARQTRARKQQELQDWLAAAPRLVCENASLRGAYERGLVDLAALQYIPLITAGQSLPAAGLPWFMTMFGRDSIITCLQSLPFLPGMAATTLRALALAQGGKLDDFRDEEPGKIIHEVRYGETAAFEEQPHTAYFGAADSTPLFLILLDEYERWSGDADLVRELEHDARRALAWIDGYGNLLGDGYVWYQPRNTETGLVNQCWKDSPDAISYRDGRIPGLPRATCEIQGYAYDAKIRTARLARTCWNDPAFAQRLEAEAAALKERFNRDYWVERGEYYALALDRDGGQVDALSSNMGHLLWSGIVAPDRAARVVEHLVGPRLYSGWGVRTLASDQGRYNPVGYHVGTVWPFDNSLIAWGMWRYGFRREAGLIASSIIAAAPFFEHRLPEAFAGYDRSVTVHPVQYPTACSPQAWSAATPMLLLRAVLGLEPVGDRLFIDPALPDEIGRVELLDIPGRWGAMDAFGRPEVSRKR